MNLNKLFFLLIIFCIISCNKRSSQNTIIVAQINSEKLSLETIDKEQEQKMYDLLYQVYLIRKTTTEKKISEIIIKNEAEKLGLSPDSFVNLKVFNFSQTELYSFAKKNNLTQSGIQIYNNTLQNIPINSYEGKYHLNEIYKEFKLKYFVDSLKKKYTIQMFLQPPPSPTTKLNGISAHLRGNLNSKISFWEFSDPECTECKRTSSLYLKIYHKYKNYVKFAYSYYSGDVSLSAIALESASRQNKFWEFHDSIFNSKDIYQLANNNHLDLKEFNQDLKDSTIYNEIQKNILKINKKGFFGTPTIVINGKIVNDPFSENELMKILDSLLKSNT